ncbi:Arf/Sar family, other [Strigomonas culicis]|uniref:Arf/Sar family, other n=1 Tax=Strigomonas culicis TaxID=28005 RepID=S9U8K0_9TRYP|nr:Arf/Sar family, other [Strigomonas culicis]|eukprot:EPY25233.1 Arf/Sar family, other [Strigomonas culicis]
MGSFLAKLKGLFSDDKKLELCLVGLENSGKTTLLNVLALGHPVETFPTIGLNVKAVKKEGVCMKMWDLGGQERFRSEWGRYTQGCDCVVYCVDAADYSRVETAGKELARLLSDSALNGLPLLVCLNKIDLEPHMSKEECIQMLELAKLSSNPWVVVPISAVRQINIGEVVDWLVGQSHED